MTRILVLVLFLGLAACTDSAPSGEIDSAADGTTVTSVGEAPSTTVAETVPSTTIPPTRFEGAVAATISASSYEFGGQLIVVQGSGQSVTGLHGWVHDGDQLIVTEVGDQVVETLVVDDVAIITKDGESTAVEMGTVEAAPSFEILGMIDVREEASGLVSGLIPASIMNGDDATGFLDVTVWFTDVIVAYSVLDPSGAWELSMTFSEVGTFDPADLP